MGDVGDPGVGVVDIEGTRVDFVHTESAVKVYEGGDAGADPADCLGGGGCTHGAVIAVVDHDLILMLYGSVGDKETLSSTYRVAKKYVSNDVR